MNNSEKLGEAIAKAMVFVISGCIMAILIALTIKIVSWIF